MTTQVGASNSASIFVAMIAVVLSAAAPAPAVSLPLNGYYRAGRFMPVRIDAGDREQTVSGRGVIPTTIAAGFSGVVPVLVPARDAGPLDDGTPLIELSPNQRLVAIESGADLAIARRSFPGREIVGVEVAPGIGTSASSTIAWDVLDAIVTADHVIVLRRDDPTPGLPPIEADRYVLSSARRSQVLAVSALVMLACLFAAFVPGRRRSVLSVLLVGACCVAGIETWRRSEFLVRTLAVNGGEVERAVESIRREREASRWTPCSIDTATAARASMSLRVSASGSMKWSYVLEPGEQLAWQARGVTPSSPAPER